MIEKIIDTHAHFGHEPERLIAEKQNPMTSQSQKLIDGIDQLRSTVGYTGLSQVDTSVDSLINDLDKNYISMAWIHQLSFKDVLGYDVLPNDVIAKAVNKYPERFIGFAGIDPRSKNKVEELVDAIEGLGLSGLKFNPNDYGGYYINDKKLCYPLFEKASEMNLPVSIHTGLTPGSIFRMKHNDPTLVDDIAVDFPNLTLIVEHMGYPWTDLCYNMAMRHPNMYLTITATANILIHNNPIGFHMEMSKMLGILGSEKILWGSDWTATPNMQEVIEFILEAEMPMPMQYMGAKGLTDKDRENMLYSNAIKIMKQCNVHCAL